jgi:hypothetical protein
VTEELPVAELAAALASALLGLDDGAPLEVVVRVSDGRTAPVVGVLYDPARGLLELSTHRSLTGRLHRDYDSFRENLRMGHEDWLERQLRNYQGGPMPTSMSVGFPLDREVLGDLYGFPTAATPVTDPLRDVRPEPAPEPEAPS